MLTDFLSLVANYRMNIRGILHLGANVGEEAEIYNSAGVGKVLWIEAIPATMPLLEKNVIPYGHEFVNACVTDVTGDLKTLHVANNMMSSSILPFGTHSQRAPKCVFTHDLELGTITLDDLCAARDFHDFNFYNLDIQGAELLALKGSINELKHVDWIYTEINFDELYVGCARAWELDEFLYHQGFYRVETWMAHGGVGWGDALYARLNYVR